VFVCLLFLCCFLSQLSHWPLGVGVHFFHVYLWLEAETFIQIQTYGKELTFAALERFSFILKHFSHIIRSYWILDFCAYAQPSEPHQITFLMCVMYRILMAEIHLNNIYKWSACFTVTHYVSITTTTLKLFREETTVHCEIHMIHIYTLCGSVVYSNHYTLKGQNLTWFAQTTTASRDQCVKW
jgi:hypothetical protein